MATDAQWGMLATKLMREWQTSKYFKSLSNAKLAKCLVRLVGYNTPMFSDSDALLHEIEIRLTGKES